LRVLARVGTVGAIDAGIRLTPPYGKSASWGQMRQRTCSNAQPGTAQPPLVTTVIARACLTGRDSIPEALAISREAAADRITRSSRVIQLWEGDALRVTSACRRRPSCSRT
jgi:hypothetical protein